MAGLDAVTTGSSKPAAAPAQTKNITGWPLAYSLQPPKQTSTLQTFGVQTDRPAATKKRWWSYTLYRGPGDKPVEILYSKTRGDSETIAQQFVSEEVVGFDMEWPWNGDKRPGLQNKVGLIQLATQEKVALFHIGLHPGKTTADIIAPTLRRIIESPTIGKIGVSVLNADFSRLKKYFGLEPKAAIELSHLHRLVTHGTLNPKMVSTKMVSLAQLVEKHLGLPLYKGDVRTSNWSKPLSQDQIKYAAGDAYAGLMLYHCLSAKRLKMNPVPPPPIHADKYLTMVRGLPKVTRLLLEPFVEGDEPIPSDVFFGVLVRKETYQNSKTASNSKQTSEKPNKDTKSVPTTKMIEQTGSMDETSRRLYEELVRRRSTLATAAKVEQFKIVHNSVLERIALQRPLTIEELGKIKGVGKFQQEKYGEAWIEVITKFLTTGKSTQRGKSTAVSSRTLTPSTPKGDEQQPKTVREESPDSSPAFEERPPPRTAQLHTGISFSFAETSISKPECETVKLESLSQDLDSSLPSLDFDIFDELSSRRSSGQKRKRAASPLKPSRASPSPAEATAQAYQDDAQKPLLKVAETKIFKNKLVAFSKLVTRRLPPRPADAPPIVSDDTLDLIVRKPPRTHEELRQIAGIQNFFQSCLKADTDLLKNIVKFTPAET